MDMQLRYAFAFVDCSYAKDFTRPGKFLKFRDDLRLFLLWSDNNIGFSEAAGDENRRRFDLFGNGNFVYGFIKVFTFI